MRKVVFALAITLCLLYTFTVGASAHATQTLQVAHVHSQLPVALSKTPPEGVAGCKPSFPNDATMTWNNIAYQAWMRPVEGTDRHFNYAIQNCGPTGPSTYVVNFHITLLSLDKGEWQTSDSKQGTKTWGGSSGYLCTNWYDAGYAITNYISDFVGSSSGSLYTASVDQVLAAMNVQLYNACGN